MLRANASLSAAIMAGSLILAACGSAAAPPSASQASAQSQAAAGPASKAAGSASAAASAAAKPASSGSELATVTLATSSSNSEAGWMFAQEKGYFQQAGIKLDIQSGISTNDRLALLAKGDIDMTNISPSAGLFNAIKRGVEVKLVAAQQIVSKGHHGDVAMVARKQLFDSGQLDDIKKLKGKTVAISGTGGIGDVQLLKTLERAGLTSTDATAKYMDLTQMLPALSGGQVDAALLFGSLELQAVKDGIGKPIIFADDMYPDAIVSIWLYSPAFSKKTDLAKKWMVPYLKGVRDYNDALNQGKDKQALVDAMIKYTSLKDRATYDQINWPYLDPNGAFDSTKLIETQDVFANMGLLTSGKVDLQQVVDKQFMDYALQQLGPYKP